MQVTILLPDVLTRSICAEAENKPGSPMPRYNILDDRGQHLATFWVYVDVPHKGVEVYAELDVGGVGCSGFVQTGVKANVERQFYLAVGAAVAAAGYGFEGNSIVTKGLVRGWIS